MRTFIILLLLTNIGYFGWNEGWLRDLPPPAPQAAIPVQSSDNLPPFQQAPASLMLVTELNEEERSALLHAPSPIQGESVLNDGLLAESSELASVPGAEMAALDVVARLSTDLVSSEKTEENQAGEPVLAPAGSPWCAELGSFTEAAQAQRLIPALAALGTVAEVQSQQVPVSSTFWVYMPAFASDAEARRMLMELQNKQIDSFYMRDGQFSGGISLGVFSRRSSAETVQASMAQQGYTAEVGEVFREETRYSLALRAPTTVLLQGGQWANLMAENPGLKLTENVCEGVASGY